MASPITAGDWLPLPDGTGQLNGQPNMMQRPLQGNGPMGYSSATPLAFAPITQRRGSEPSPVYQPARIKLS